MAKKLKTALNLIEWCDKQITDGTKLSIGWEGGGDSGWCYFMMNDEKVSEDEHSEIFQLLSLMYDELDYGSWAGEFSANGEAVYDPEEKAFVGVDHYSEDQVYEFEYPVKIVIPKNIWFETFEVNIENEDPYVQVGFNIRNGFLSPQHQEIEENIVQELKTQINNGIEAYQHMDDVEDYQSMWQTELLNRSDFTEEGDYLIGWIKTLNLTVANVEEKDIYLELTNENNED